MAKDISNQRFSKLVAVKIVGKKNSNNIWECVCDCGNSISTTATSLLGGNTRSCGCLIVETMASLRKDITGKKFGYLTVIADLPSVKGRRFSLVKCDCGNEKTVNTYAMTSGRIISCSKCGKKKKTIKHGLSGNRLYFVWKSMIDRCYNPKFKHYRNYGGRGIAVDERWMSLEQFVSDMSDGYEKGLELDRIDNDKSYSKCNCRWSTKIENNRNKRTNVRVEYEGKTYVLKELSDILSIPYSSFGAMVKKRGIDYAINFYKNKKK